MSAKLIIDTTRIDGLLAGLPVLARTDEIKKGLRRGGDVIAGEQRRLVPRMAGASKDVLAESIDKKIVEGDTRITAIVGPRATAGHARPVEEGHRIVITRGANKGQDTGRRATARPFVEPSAAAVGQQAIAAVEASIAKALAKLGG